jgi:hypothetical protein
MKPVMQSRNTDIAGTLAVIVLFVVVFLLCWHTLTSIYQDIGRHLTLGGIIWDTKTVPRTNLFSYTNADYPFMNHHWLGEVFLYLAERVVGLTGLIALKAVLITAAFVLAFAAAFRRHVLMPALITGLVAAFVLLERTDVRPEILSFLFLAWYLFVLYRGVRMNSEWRIAKFRFRTSSFLLCTLPLAQLLWVNTHIYFFVGPFVFVAWVLGEIARDGWVVLRSRRPWLLGGSIAAATLVNPWFIAGAFQPLTIMSDYGYSIVENKSYFFLRGYGYQSLTTVALYLGFVLTGLSFVLNRRRLRENVMGAVLAGGTAVLALIMVRNYPLFAFVMLPVVLRNLDQAGVRWFRRGAWMAVAMLILVVASIVQGQVFARVSDSMRFGRHIPEGHQRAVDFFREAGIRGPSYNNFDIGSYLIWKLPEEPVFIDGRPEAYPSAFLQETYIRSQEREDVWERVLAEYGINAIFWNTRDITPWSFTFMARLQEDPQWVRVYSAGGIDIYVRNAAQNASIIDLYESR